jgi:hypothetical protein
MPRSVTQSEAITIGQLAKRWGIGVDRARSLVVDEGVIPGAFKIPSSGCYGETIKIPISSVLCMEQEWAISSKDKRLTERQQQRRKSGQMPKLKHLPELNVPLGAAAEYPEVALG